MGKFKLLMLICLFFTIIAVAQTYSGGSGTATDPYLISSKADMETLANAVNANYMYSRDKYFLLTQDITDAVTTVIGNTVGTDNFRPFKGTFDGGGFKINVNINITISDQSSLSIGVFGNLEGATIKNLGVVGSITISFSSYNTFYYAGGICGNAQSNTKIANCYNISNISCSNNYNRSYTGGICGYAFSYTTIANCFNIGNITNHSLYCYCGGICGESASGDIKECFNIGTIESQGYCGGICGSAQNDIVKSFNTGTIISLNNNNMTVNHSGGICGYSYSSITNCYNTGNIINYWASSTGGICGETGYGPNANCYNIGNIISYSYGDLIFQYGTGTGGIGEGESKNCFAANHTIKSNIMNQNGSLFAKE